MSSMLVVYLVLGASLLKILDLDILLLSYSAIKVPTNDQGCFIVERVYGAEQVVVELLYVIASG